MINLISIDVRTVGSWPSAWSHLGPFSVADGRPQVIVELGVVTAFVVLAAMAITERSAPSTPPRSAG
jgi:hypothetical protein